MAYIDIKKDLKKTFFEELICEKKEQRINGATGDKCLII
tara:strand:+ start:6525 stop:6641 length:117 start_codon:yes stop_codon:yes gene_type:complete